MPLNELGPYPLHIAAWAIAILSFSLLAFLLVLQREKEKGARIIWLILLVALPIFSHRWRFACITCCGSPCADYSARRLH